MGSRHYMKWCSRMMSIQTANTLMGVAVVHGWWLDTIDATQSRKENSVCITIAQPHPQPALLIHADPTQNLHMLSQPLTASYLHRSTVGLWSGDLDANRRDSKMSSEVNNVGLLTTEMILLLTAADWCWYNADRSDAHLPICKTVDFWAPAARAMVGADIRIDCVLNHLPSEVLRRSLDCWLDVFVQQTH